MPQQRISPHSSRLFSLPVLSILALSVPWMGSACQSNGPIEDRESPPHVSNRAEQAPTSSSAQQQRLAPVQHRSITINATSTLSDEQINAISRRLERQTKAEQVRVLVQKHKQQKNQATMATLEILLEGSNFPDIQVLEDDLRQSFPGLARAEIAISDTPNSTSNTPLDPATQTLIETEEPEIAEQILRDRLQEQLFSQGIKDDQLQVQVQDDERGRQVEVRIEKKP